MRMKRRNLNDYVLVLMALLPLLVALLMVFRSGAFDMGVFGQQFHSLGTIGFFGDIHDFIVSNLMENTENPWLLFLIDYFNYIIIVLVVDLLFNSLFIFFKIIRNFLNKLGGDF